jgi:hypothetical protein
MAENGAKVTVSVNDLVSAPLIKINQSLARFQEQGQKTLAPFKNLNKEFGRFYDLTGIRKLSGALKGTTGDIVAMSKAGGALADVFKIGVTGGILGAVAAVGKLVLATNGAVVSTKVQASNLGISYQQDERLDAIGRQRGLSQGQVGAAFESSQDAIRNAIIHPGSNPILINQFRPGGVFGNLHANVSDPRHPFQANYQQQQLMLRDIANIKDARLRHQISSAAGLSGTNAITDMGENQVNQYISNANRLNVGKDYSKGATDLQTALGNLDTQFSTMSSNLVGPLREPFAKFVGQMTDLANTAIKFENAHPLESLVIAMGGFSAALAVVSKSLAFVLGIAGKFVGIGGKDAAKAVETVASDAVGAGKKFIGSNAISGVTGALEDSPGILTKVAGAWKFIPIVGELGGLLYTGAQQVNDIYQGFADPSSVLNPLVSRQLAGYNPVYNPAGSSMGGFRNIRNNNPGNLKFAHQDGATEDSSGFAVFKTMNEGIQATAHQLMLDQDRGARSIMALEKDWDKDPNAAAHANMIAKQLGVNANSAFDLTNPDNMNRFITALSQTEGGKVDIQITHKSDGTHKVSATSSGKGISKPKVATSLPPTFV